jgi:hypothetical protein
MTPSKAVLTRTSLRTPKAAAIAGIIFSILLTVIVSLLRLSVPTDPLEPGAWLATNSETVKIAMNLVPFDGVAFLWFIGVLRDRLGQKEDRFFSTVFFGSGLLFLAMLFTAAGVIAAIIFVFASRPENIVDSTTYHLTRTIAYTLMNVYAIKMAAVFMFSTSTVTLFTDLAPRWIAYLGFVLASIILLVGQNISWSIFVVAAWVFLISTYILIDNLRSGNEAVPLASPD